MEDQKNSFILLIMEMLGSEGPIEPYMGPYTIGPYPLTWAYGTAFVKGRSRHT